MTGNVRQSPLEGYLQQNYSMRKATAKRITICPVFFILPHGKNSNFSVSISHAISSVII